jgi:hypothetical protein
LHWCVVRVLAINNNQAPANRSLIIIVIVIIINY